MLRKNLGRLLVDPVLDGEGFDGDGSCGGGFKATRGGGGGSGSGRQLRRFPPGAAAKSAARSREERRFRLELEEADGAGCRPPRKGLLMSGRSAVAAAAAATPSWFRGRSTLAGDGAWEAESRADGDGPNGTDLRPGRLRMLVVVVAVAAASGRRTSAAERRVLPAVLLVAAEALAEGSFSSSLLLQPPLTNSGTVDLRGCLTGLAAGLAAGACVVWCWAKCWLNDLTALATAPALAWRPPLVSLALVAGDLDC